MTYALSDNPLHDLSSSQERRKAAAQTLLAAVRGLAREDGCHPLGAGGMRLYRYSRPMKFVKTQLLVPGLVLVLQGRKSAWIDRREWQYEPFNHLVMLREAVCRAAVVEATPSEPYLAIAVDLPVEALLKAAIAVREVGAGPAGSEAGRPATTVAHTDAETFDTVTRLVRTVVGPGGWEAALRPLILEELCVRLLSSCSAAALLGALAEPREARRILEVMRSMRLRSAEKLGVADWARETSMSPAHFSRRFRAVAGVAPMRYVRRCRLEAALLLMVEKHLSASEAGYQVGYESQAHFSREFKSAYGAPPAQYVAALALHGRVAPPEHDQARQAQAKA
nr:AraC family transcriptional regulator [uncultured Caldimonas sp.]